MSEAPPFQYILYGKQAGVAHITLNRPERLNALGMGPGTNRDEIGRALVDADADPDIGCVLISAAGRAFCGGGDLVGNKRAETVLDNFLFHEAIEKSYGVLRGMHKPVIAAVHGLCLGAGVCFIAYCDFVIAADDAKFGLIEGRTGFPGASDIVPLVGPAWAKFMIFTGEMLDAQRAEEIGLVLTVVPAAELLDRCRSLAERIARMPREALLLNKACIDNMAEAMGRGVARMVGRRHDTITKSMAGSAKAPDGRFFLDILKTEGMEGFKKARDQQYSGAWLEARKKP